MNQQNLKFSRKIQDIEYNEDTYVLTIYFNTNITKRYFDVPHRIYNNLLRAIDKDQFYQTAIDGVYCVE